MFWLIGLLVGLLRLRVFWGYCGLLLLGVVLVCYLVLICGF